MTRRHGQRPQWNSCGPSFEDAPRRWRAPWPSPRTRRASSSARGRSTLITWATFYASGADAPHGTFDLGLATALFRAEAPREVVERSERSLAAGAWPLWTLGNRGSPWFRWAYSVKT